MVRVTFTAIFALAASSLALSTEHAFLARAKVVQTADDQGQRKEANGNTPNPEDIKKLQAEVDEEIKSMIEKVKKGGF
ncbi:hypothetical protein QQS21_008850 [Conoideocrella luteorostrata]|uniref:RxLR effector protein n=1 Tax=Conoideocrella luteorostrata TaxID=1105319 RepID=A0AAJ0CKE8_9HYPO|nr:hypothetical protein QQS21_008850 [Conoideocrella luteorostrata]